MKSTRWRCIAWEKKRVGANTVVKNLVSEKPIDQTAALNAFKRQYPGLRNHTA